MSNIDALMGLGISDEEQLKMLADSLRGRQRAADFFALSSVEPISRAAEGEQKRVNTSAAQAGLLNKALQERQWRSEENEKDRAALFKRALVTGSRYGRGTKKYDYVRSMLDENGERVLMGLSKETGEWERVKGSEGYTPDPLTSSQMGGLMERAYTRMKPLEDMVLAVEELDNMLEAHAGGDPRSIPGLTFGEKLPVVGGALRLTRDLYTGKGEAGSTYSAAKGVMNYITRYRAGLTQTNRELQNVKEETGMDAMADPQVFLINLDRIKNALEEDLQRIRNTMSPEVVDQIESEYIMMGQQSPFGHKFRRHNWEQPKGGEQGLIDMFTTPEMPEGGKKPISEMTDEEIRQELGM